MNFSTILTVIIIIAAILLVLCNTPSGIEADSDNIYMSTLLGNAKVIPVSEITFKELPEGSMKHMIRVNGASIGKIKYGHFKNTETGQKMFLFITGRKDCVSFEYDGRIYVTDNWK